MASASVEVHKEVQYPADGGWKLCFQCVTYHYDDRDDENGYRFIWRRHDDSLQAARGQARIPSASVLRELVSKAEKAGWLK